MHRTPSIVGVVVATAMLLFSISEAFASQDCRIDPLDGRVECSASGGSQVRNPLGTPPSDGPPARSITAPLRYVITGYDPVIGDCYRWSRTPGGLDAWDPANDPAVIAITTRLPICPRTTTAVSDPVASAWSIFRSWNLDPPVPSVTPAQHGITGIPTHVSAAEPASISHSEVLPDGRVLEVRARPASLTIDWGDGTVATYDPATASGYPTGATAHIYELKTCTASYRTEHPSGSLCDPTAPSYTITASYTWQGEYSIGSGWTALGSLDRPAPGVGYDIDEARGVPSP